MKMKMVIEIDEDVFTRLFDNGIEDYTIADGDLFAIAKSIRKSTPLPEHHGDLIDVDVLKNNIHYVPIAPLFQDDYVTYRNVIFADILDMLPTIIERSDSKC